MIDAQTIIDWFLSSIQRFDATTRMILFFTLFLIFYVAIIWFTDTKKSTAVGLAFIPILLIDLTLSFGKYTFMLPLNYNYTIGKGIFTINLLDFILNFQIFKLYGVEMFKQVTGTYLLTWPQQILVWIFTIGDSILAFLLLLFFFKNVLADWTYAFLCALVPSVLYLNWSNPLKEFNTVTTNTQHIFYFFNNASGEQFIIVVATFLTSFAIIVLLLSTIINMLAGIGKSTVMPGLESTMWQFNVTGIAFQLALLYAVLQLLHPEVTWFVALPLLVIWGVIKRSLKGHADSVKEKREFRESIGEAMNDNYDNYRQK